MATIKDVSDRSGVSQATVSRVINGTSRVSLDKKHKVEQAIQELDYRPNSIAQALASNRSWSIGIVVPELGGPFYSNILQNIEEQLRRFGYHAIITSGSVTSKSQKEAIEFLLDRRVDGLILYTQYLSDEYLVELNKSSKPIVLVNRFLPELEDSCVYIDNEIGGRLATECLLSKGHKNIACITGPMYYWDARERLNGYKKALKNAGIKFNENLVFEAEYTETSGKDAINSLFSRAIKFSAIFALNDHMAFGAIEEMKKMGMKIPNDISIVGFDNVLFSRYLTPALTTINFPVNNMSIEAVRLMLSKLNNRYIDVEYKLLPTLVSRNSVITA